MTSAPVAYWFGRSLSRDCRWMREIYWIAAMQMLRCWRLSCWRAKLHGWIMLNSSGLDLLWFAHILELAFGPWLKTQQKTARPFFASLSCLDSLSANSKFQWLQLFGSKGHHLVPLQLHASLTIARWHYRRFQWRRGWKRFSNDLATKLRTYPWRFQYLEVPPDAIFQDSFSKLYNYAKWLMFLKVLKRQS